MYKEKMRSWANNRADHKQTSWWLALLSFSESSFFLVPPDVFLIGILMTSRRFAYYAFITTISSVLGGAFGYLIGIFFFDTIGQTLVDLYGLQDEMAKVGQLFNNNALVAIFLSAFTPIPYKIFTISAGFFHINFIIFMLASLLGRGLRFFLEAYAMKLWGKTVGKMIYHYFNLFTFIVGALVVLGIFYFYYF
ncbi:MAG: hypothetical protein A2589_00210 [Candidatus Vogelbacteria bacterium RIFOXYD1_FULL_46_19]|uniref:VTT domain-containing protein n=1 Tax=Candidatus Vogelbacteria bacterium RIFOXYD1_FULL_46_19 TaxID=1802439 RepID=A0A1G2QHS0_9BACT|nr:MAG: hypothetical protein A2589_00210 [Candidatus Vogelbacteria bacterium RIFOXYD1_FULL_46_19]